MALLSFRRIQRKVLNKIIYEKIEWTSKKYTGMCVIKVENRYNQKLINVRFKLAPDSKGYFSHTLFVIFIVVSNSRWFIVPR